MILEELDTAINSSYYFPVTSSSQYLRWENAYLDLTQLGNEIKWSSSQRCWHKIPWAIISHWEKNGIILFFFFSSSLSSSTTNTPTSTIITTTNIIDYKYNCVSASLFLDHCKKGWVVFQQTLRTWYGWYDLMLRSVRHRRNQLWEVIEECLKEMAIHSPKEPKLRWNCKSG